ncbi:hypothetical protein GCM10009868_00220 [Terrabacter aerolatus]|uniref:Uncharacterized protein n=1 Tax=Terrabacter aerolatus TaxID=422442 RepID=A0A512D311_9MICO|nr:hypothetical protein [Terrabacter aerolatus]GEO30858.1 hypothetical protein TAE01_26680 [Terrabacter aerolatus]
MEVLLRVAPEVRLSSTTSGLRASLDDPARTHVGTGVGARTPSGTTGPDQGEHLTLAELETRARQAQASGDLHALSAIEESFTSFHLANHPPRRRPEPPEAAAMPAKERALLERKAFRAALPQVSVFKRAARTKAKAIAETEADGFSRTLDLAQVVIAQHRAAALDDQWNELSGHDRCAVIAELEAEFEAAGCGCTCVDAGWDADTARGYVTIVARYPSADIVAERGPGLSSSGRRMLRRRTRAERNALYLSGLASFALAAARRAISVAVAADDVHLVIVRPLETGEGLEPIYVGSLSREAVTLRPSHADPVPLLLGSAVRPLKFEGSAHDLVAVSPEADVMDIVRLCAEALDDGALDGLLAGDSESLTAAAPDGHAETGLDGADTFDSEFADEIDREFDSELADEIDRETDPEFHRETVGDRGTHGDPATASDTASDPAPKTEREAAAE